MLRASVSLESKFSAYSFIPVIEGSQVKFNSGSHNNKDGLENVGNMCVLLIPVK